MHLLAICLALTLGLVSLPHAQERLDTDVLWKIRREATERSQIMRTLQVLTDRYGPRLTGSPNLRGAQDWIVKEATAWGLANTHLEPWEFGHPGWLNERLSVHVVSPVKDALVAEALAWTPGTQGAVRAQVVVLELPSRPSKEALAAYLESVRAQVKGRIAMIGRPQEVSVTLMPSARRRDDNEVRAQFGPDAAPPPAPVAPVTPAVVATPAPAAPPTIPVPAGTPDARNTRAPAPITANQLSEQLDAFLLSAGVVGRVNDAGRDHGQIRAFNNRSFDVARTVPTVVMRNEDYGRIARLAAQGPVELELDIVNTTYPEGRTQHNVIAEIPGSDKAGEMIMLGGHLDSWHAATGATDNAIGCAVMLEAIRVLGSVGAKPRRTIRVALWSGEEQGLLGSQAYVREHFGTFEKPKPEYATFGGYFNIDSGTGRARGYTVFGPSSAAAILRELAAPFAANGLAGATSTNSRRRGGSDHTSFNEVGLPGIGVAQDPIEYGTYTWHTNLDTYERIIESDAQQSAMAIAFAVYQLAMRDELLPRFDPKSMPALPSTPTP